jgi:hypothetical protein
LVFSVAMMGGWSLIIVTILSNLWNLEKLLKVDRCAGRIL